MSYVLDYIYIYIYMCVCDMLIVMRGYTCLYIYVVKLHVVSLD